MGARSAASVHVSSRSEQKWTRNPRWDRAWHRSPPKTSTGQRALDPEHASGVLQGPAFARQTVRAALKVQSAAQHVRWGPKVEDHLEGLGPRVVGCRVRTNTPTRGEEVYRWTQSTVGSICIPPTAWWQGGSDRQHGPAAVSAAAAQRAVESTFNWYWLVDGLSNQRPRNSGPDAPLPAPAQGSPSDVAAGAVDVPLTAAGLDRHRANLRPVRTASQAAAASTSR